MPSSSDHNHFCIRFIWNKKKSYKLKKDFLLSDQLTAGIFSWKSDKFRISSYRWFPLELRALMRLIYLTSLIQFRSMLYFLKSFSIGYTSTMSVSEKNRRFKRTNFVRYAVVVSAFFFFQILSTPDPSTSESWEMIHSG